MDKRTECQTAHGPTTYAQWVQCLDLLRTCSVTDAALVQRLAAGELSWTTGVAERFWEKLMSVMDARLKNGQERFSRRVNTPGKSMQSILEGMLILRREYTFLVSIARQLPIPQTYQEKLEIMIMEHSDQTQETLENSARSDCTGKMLSIMRNNRVNNFSKEVLTYE